MSSQTPRLDQVERNLIINGNMDFWQRGITLAASTALKYLADRFNYQVSSLYTAGGATQSQSTDVPTQAQSGFSSRYSLLITNGTGASPGTADFEEVSYKMEGQDYQQIHGRKCRLQFWVKSSVTGTYSLNLQNFNSTRSYTTTYSIASANTWQKIALDIPLDTSGTWNFDNTIGLLINWVLTGGTSLQSSTLNTWGAASGSTVVANTQTQWGTTTGATFQLAQVMLIPQDFTQAGATTVDVPFQRAGRNIAHELQMCQRYYEKSDNQSSTVLASNVGYYIAAPAGLKIYIPFRTTKRANPTLQQYSYATTSTGVYRDVTANVDRTGTMSSAIADNGFSFDATGTTAGNSVAVGWTADSEL